MNSFFNGFMSLFSWIDSYHDLSPQERVKEILDQFYSDNPNIERDDNKALEKDFENIWKDFK